MDYFTTIPAQPIVLDPEMRRVYHLLDRIAPSTLPVLLLGETGSGKDVAAEWLHHRSQRPSQRFVRVNCAALSGAVVESELFGHERGAFTGAQQAHEGLFEAADGGTLFLDEIGELSTHTQAKLLRVLESGELLRVGSTRPRYVDVRLVAATNRHLPSLVQSGHFREDLYFRLNAITVTVPRLRDRPCEILPLATFFLHRAAERLKRAPLELGESAAAALYDHPWPGNVRELRHVMERAVILCHGVTLTAQDLALASASATPPAISPTPAEPARTPSWENASPSAKGMRGALREFERRRILAALEATGGNQTRAAILLGISRRTLTNKLNAHSIQRPRKSVRVGLSMQHERVIETT